MGLMSPEIDSGSVLPVDFLPSLSLPGFPQFHPEIVPLKVRKTPGKYHTPEEEESLAAQRWNVATRSVAKNVDQHINGNGDTTEAARSPHAKHLDLRQSRHRLNGQTAVGFTDREQTIGRSEGLARP